MKEKLIKVRQALVDSTNIFETYASIHTAKCTDDGLAKAKENRRYSVLMQEATTLIDEILATLDSPELVERACQAALEHMPALSQRTIKTENGVTEETITACPPFEFVERFLRPAMIAALNSIKDKV